MKFIPEKVEGNMRNHMKGIVFLLTDTMDSRREIAENSLKLNNQVLAVIETRMAISHGNVFCFDPKNLTQYNKWVNTLISDDEGEESACGTSLTVGTTASIIANLAVNHMMTYLTNPDVIPDDITDVFLNPLILNTRTWGTIHG
jgi:molybdopterin/thiamine biosynthesis adenylyltransferase